ncbi:MAG TPA: MDR family MFS transporter [Propionibacteriaceae bacterium]|nr:MDR family MFS transporter [Propionibacteriaceae bacterium]
MGEQAVVSLDRRTERLIIWTLMLAAFVVILNETIMSVALPTLMTDLRVSATTVQWVTTGFMLTMAVVIPTTGFLQERLSTRAVFLLSMSLFCLGTLLGATAANFWLLIVARVVQACGTAIMLPLLTTTTLVVVPVERRGQVMGLTSVVISLAPALGPTVSGFVLEYFSWRWLFWLMLPIALLMLGLGSIRLVSVGESRRVPLDVTSVGLSVLGFGGLVYGLSQLGSPGASVPVAVGSLVVAAVGLLLFGRRQVRLVREDRAFLDLGTFRVRNFRLAIAVLCITFAALIGVSLLWPIFLQQVRGVSPVTTGLMLLPGGLAMGVAGPLVGRLFDRFGARVIVVPATSVLVVMLGLMGLSTAGTALALLVVMHFLFSLSLSFVFTPTFTGGLNDLTPHQYSHGSALFGTLQQVAGAGGTALLISIMAARRATLSSGGVDAVRATQGGVQAALWAAGLLCLAAIAIATRIRTTPARPAPEAAFHPRSVPVTD